MASQWIGRGGSLLCRWLRVSKDCDARTGLETDTALPCLGGCIWFFLGAFSAASKCVSFVFAIPQYYLVTSTPVFRGGYKISSRELWA